MKYKRWRIGLVAGVVILVGLGVGGWHAFHTKQETDIKMHRIEFTSLPPNDDALIEWLKAQPDVSEVSVQREGNMILVKYEVSVKQSTPDLLGKLESLGYTGRVSSSNDGKKQPKGP